MNILQVLPELHVGGVETGTVDLARYLVKHNHKAVVVSHGGELVGKLLECKALHYLLPVHSKSIVHILRMAFRLKEIIKKERIDIVHARSRAPAWSAFLATRMTGVTFITTCHGYYSDHFFSYAMGWGKKVIVLSNVIARHMIDDFGVPYDRIRLIPRSVDLEAFHFISPEEKRKKEFNVGIIARITPLKGHMDFIKAMAKVSRQVPELKIWIIGDAPASKDAYKEQLRLLVHRLGLWQSTEFLGTQRDIPGILEHLDCLVMATTTQEAFGRVIIEAQAAGVPVVATKVGGSVDIIEDGRTGLLVPPADPQGIADAVVRISKDIGLAKSIAQQAYAKVKAKYTLETMMQSTIDTYADALNNFNILFIKLSSVGDVILATPAIRAIRRHFTRNYKIIFLVGSEARDVLLRCPYIDELIVCDLKHKDRGLPGMLKLARILRKKNIDISIDLQNNRKSHILSYASLALKRYGYKRKFGFLLNEGIIDTKEVLSPVEHQFRILRELGVELKDRSLELWPGKEDERFVQEFLSAEWVNAHQKIVGINMGASPRWESKNWPLEHMQKLCEALSLKDIRVVVTGTEKDIPRALQLAHMVKNARIINACGKTTINQLACLVRRCSVYICGDSAPLHVAAAMKTPFVALFGPTDPKRHLPSAEKYALLKKELSCSPCYKPRCSHKKCLKQISVDEVLREVEKLMR